MSQVTSTEQEIEMVQYLESGEEAPGDEFRALRDKWYVKM